MPKTDDVVTYTIREAVAEKVDDHIEIAIEAEDGTRLKLRGDADRLDALVGDLDAILEADDADDAEAEQG